MSRALVALLLMLLGAVAPTEAYKFASGSYTVGGTASDDRTIDISDTSGMADFQPAFVAVKCSAVAQSVWNPTGTDSSNYFTFPAAPIANAIQSFVSNGFVVGTDATVQSLNSTCYYMALAGDGINNDFAVGSYTGNGADDRNIDISDTSAYSDFQPGLALVKSTDGTAEAWLVLTAIPSGTSCIVDNGVCNTNRLQGFHATGFQTGTAAATNGNLIPYVYMALKDTSTSGSGTYTGNATDNRDITTVGFQPQNLWIKGDTTQHAHMRLLDHSGDSSISFNETANGTNAIQSFLSTGFQVGTASPVNSDTIAYYWHAMREMAVVGQRLRFIW